MSKKVISYLFFCFLAVSHLEAQQYNFRNYTVKDGVAQSQVYSLLQDHRGYLWMGTRGGGMTRFDGITFKTFTEKDGLVNNYVHKIREDARHNLWITTNNGISHFNGIKFRNYRPEGYPSQVSVQDIAFDPKGRKWLATNFGLMLFDGEHFVNVSESLGQGTEMINCLYADKKGDIWYGSPKGLFRVSGTAKGFKLTAYGEQSRYMKNAITSVRQDASGKLWIGTYGDGVYCYDGKRFFRIDWNQELYRQTVLDIYFDRQENVWLATLGKGIIQYNTVSKSFSGLTEREGLSNNHVRSIVQDNSGSFWFGTSGGGVCNYSGKQFTNYDQSTGLGGSFIYSIFRDSKKRLWIGNSQKGLSRMDKSGVLNFSAATGFADVKVKAIHEDNEGNVYFGTDGQGMFKYDGVAFTQVEGLAQKYVRAIVKDQEGNLWIATAGNGLLKLVLDGSSPRIMKFGVSDGLLANRLTSLHYDKRGRIWYGTESNGVGMIVNDEPQMVYLRMKEGLRSNAIRCFAEDRNGYLWIGTAGSGICSVPLYRGELKVSSYDQTSGLTSSNIYLLTTDIKNNLIAGSETGLDYIYLNEQRKPVSIKHYSKGDGFTGIETCQNSVFNDADGTIWFGTINGLSRYNPANLVRNESEPVTGITDVKLFYESISETPFRKFAGDWNQVSWLDLPYDKNHLSFDFMAINFSNPEGVRYRWKLVGFDKEWSPESREHSILYSNMSPGNYTFLVKACNEDGVWNKRPVRIDIRIAAPFWLQWWFIAIELIIGFGLVFLIFKWQTNRIRANSAEAQKKLQMAMEIIELEQKALRLQMNPHFIFNALNSIQSQIGTGNEQEARYYLAKFSRLMRQILDNSRNAFITLEEEVNTLENYLLVEKFCNGNRFDYIVRVDENIEQDFVKIPPMLLQPFVENAIKHGLKFMEESAEKRGLIEVEFSEKGNILECSVKDNGIGRIKADELNKNSKETYHRSTALLVTQERLDLLQEEDEGRQSLEIIDLYDAHGNASGTKVVVRIRIN